MLVAGRTFELYIPGVIRLGWVPRARLNIYQRRSALQLTVSCRGMR